MAQKLEIIIMWVIFALALILLTFWFDEDEYFKTNTEKKCLRKWHEYTITQEIGNVDFWLELEKCIDSKPKYKELYEKYGKPKE